MTPLNGNCVCIPHTEKVNGICNEICGDGVILFSQDPLACDDGNTMDGDGCSSTCFVESGYRCGTSSPSNCVYYPEMTLSVSSIQHTEEVNQGIFEFKLYPVLFVLNQMNLSQNFNFSCASTYNVASFSYQDGIISIIVDFYEDLEDIYCNVSL